MFCLLFCAVWQRRLVMQIVALTRSHCISISTVCVLTCIEIYMYICIYILCIYVLFHNRNFLLLLLLRAFSRTQARLFCTQLLGLPLLLFCYHSICFVLHILSAVSVSYILRCTRTHRSARTHTDTHRYSDECVRKSDDWKAASSSASTSASTAATWTQRNAAQRFYFILFIFFVFLVCQFVFEFLACRRVSLFSVNSICTLCIKYIQNHLNINWKLTFQ